MESLRSVCDLLTHRKRQDLADLLVDASIDFELVDVGVSLRSDVVTADVNAVVHAPISTYDQILALSDKDEGLIWEAVYDVYPNVEGDQVILGCSFRLDTRPFPITGNVDSFLAKEFEIPNLGELPVTSEVSSIIQDRLDEAQLCFSNGAYLSTILLCGSILEAVLRGAAGKDPKTFNQSKASPKRDGKVKKFSEWKLAEFIDVAHDVGLLRPEVREFSHALRNFRNYIHPHKQIEADFKPDEITAEICYQALRAALVSISGNH